jgi:hypothetical protein
LAVQQKLHTIAESRLSELRRQEVAVKELEVDLVQFFNGELMPAGPLAATVARRFRVLAARKAAIEKARAAQER